MVKECIVLGHIISNIGIKVDKAKVDLISNLSPPKSVKEVRSFLDMLVFIEDSSKNLVKFLNPYAIYLLRMHLLSSIILVLMLLKNLRNC